MIDRIRLTSTAKNQLITLKRRTGIHHYNALCRHALCLSLVNPSPMPKEDLHFAGGIEIEWDTLAGELQTVLINLIQTSSSNAKLNDQEKKQIITQHINRGLSYLSNLQLNDIINSQALQAKN